MKAETAVYQSECQCNKAARCKAEFISNQALSISAESRYRHGIHDRARRSSPTGINARPRLYLNCSTQDDSKAERACKSTIHCSAFATANSSRALVSIAPFDLLINLFFSESVTSSSSQATRT